MRRDMKHAGVREIEASFCLIVMSLTGKESKGAMTSHQNAWEVEAQCFKILSTLGCKTSEPLVD